MVSNDDRKRFVPDNLQGFFYSLYNCPICRVSTSSEPLPNTQCPLLISVVRNEIAILHDFLSHYRALGIKRFAFIDNASTDGTANFLKTQSDVDLYSAAVPFNGTRKQSWINYLILLYGYNRWYLIVDADEHVVFHGAEQHSLDSLVQLLEGNGIRLVRGFLLDMYSGSALQMLSGEPPELRHRFALFDSGPYEETVKPEMISVRGGVRKRVFANDCVDDAPELTKYPLVKLQPGEFTISPHYIWPVPEQAFGPRVLAILHYKFTEQFASKVSDALANKQYWQQSLEYRAYDRALAQNASLVLAFERSQHLLNSSTLADAGLIQELDWGNNRVQDS